MSKLETLIDATLDEHKYITFSLGAHLFALPSQDVLKIMITPSSEQGGMVNMGLVQLAQYSIQLLELPTLLKLDPKDVEQEENKEQTEEKISTPAISNSSTFLIILQAEQELWGIVVERSPDLRTISDSELKSVSTSKRLSGALRGISYVVTYEQEISSQASRQLLLILDLHKLLALSRAQASEANVSNFELATGR